MMISCEHETRATHLAEFYAVGSWKLINSFGLLGSVTVDEFGHWRAIKDIYGRPQGAVIGKPMGDNFFSCDYCGTPIVWHFTIKNKKNGKIVNIGSTCIEKIPHLDQATVLVKGLSSLKGKVDRVFKRKVHSQQIIDWFKDNMKTLSHDRHETVDNILAKDPNAYWHPAERTQVLKSGKEVKIKSTLWERKNGADKRMNDERNYWETFAEEFARKSMSQWQPKTMLPVIQKMIDTEKINLKVPELRRITEEERKELNEIMEKEISNYLEMTNQNE